MDKFSDKKILITGGTGFIGEPVVKKVIEEGAEVELIGRNKENLSTIFHSINFNEIDLLDIDELKGVLLSANNYDYVIHLAGRTGPGHIENPILDFKVNALGTLNLLSVLKEIDIERMVYGSSAEVYGKPKYLPIDETHPTHPETPYGCSKLTGDTYCYGFYHTYGLKTVSLRFFNLYGPPLSPKNAKGVVHIFTKRIFQGLPPVIAGNPENAKDYVYIDDVVDAIVSALNKRCEGEVINIGSGIPITIEYVGKTLISLINKGRDTKINNVEYDKEHNTHEEKEIFFADIAKAKKLLGYIPKFKIKEGLSEFVKWYSKTQ